jgi:hypothetical protein
MTTNCAGSRNSSWPSIVIGAGRIRRIAQRRARAYTSITRGLRVASQSSGKGSSWKSGEPGKSIEGSGRSGSGNRVGLWSRANTGSGAGGWACRSSEIQARSVGLQQDVGAAQRVEWLAGDLGVEQVEQGERGAVGQRVGVAAKPVVVAVGHEVGAAELFVQVGLVAGLGERSVPVGGGGPVVGDVGVGGELGGVCAVAAEVAGLWRTARRRRGRAPVGCPHG